MLQTNLRKAILKLRAHCGAIDNTGNGLQLRALLLSCQQLFLAFDETLAAHHEIPLSNMKIVVNAVYPPIPPRRFDFSAHIDGREDGPVGWGETPKEAIADLLVLIEGAEPLCPITGLSENIFSGPSFGINYTTDRTAEFTARIERDGL